MKRGQMMAPSILGVAALTPDKTGVWFYQQGESWRRLGDVTPRSRIFGGYGALLAEYPNGDIFLYRAGIDSWVPFGGPGQIFASTWEWVYGLTPNGAAIWRRSIPFVQGEDWAPIGGAAATMFTSYHTVFATDPHTGDLFELTQVGETAPAWQQIGGPGAAFAGGNVAVIGLNPSRDAVFSYCYSPPDPSATWIQIGGPASAVYMAVDDVAYAVSPDGKTIWRSGDPWTQVGGSASEFVVADTLYALSPDRSSSWRWTGEGTNWQQIGEAADSIVATYLCD